MKKIPILRMLDLATSPPVGFLELTDEYAKEVTAQLQMGVSAQVVATIRIDDAAELKAVSFVIWPIEDFAAISKPKMDADGGIVIPDGLQSGAKEMLHECDTKGIFI